MVSDTSLLPSRCNVAEGERREARLAWQAKTDFTVPWHLSPRNGYSLHGAPFVRNRSMVELRDERWLAHDERQPSDGPRP
jgi:hypothetical protein